MRLTLRRSASWVDAGEAAVPDLGATERDHQPGATLRVPLDPGGHPF